MGEAGLCREAVVGVDDEEVVREEVFDVVVDVGPVGGALDVAFEDVPDGLGL